MNVFKKNYKEKVKYPVTLITIDHERINKIIIKLLLYYIFGWWRMYHYFFLLIRKFEGKTSQFKWQHKNI